MKTAIFLGDIKASIICLILTSTLIGCAGAGGIQIPLGGDGGLSPAGNNATGTDVIEESEDEIGLAAQLPLPALTKDKVLTYSPDAQNYIPVIGSSGAVEYLPGAKIAVSLEPLEETVASTNQRLETRDQGLITSAHASTDFAPLINISDSPAITTLNVCDLDTVKCCDVETDGSFECYFPLTSESPTQVYLHTVNEQNHVSSGQDDIVQPNLKWLKNTPTDIAVAGDTVYTLTDGMAVKLSTDEAGNLKTNGDFNNAYENFAASGSKLAYSSTDSLVGVMGDDGVSLYDYNAGNPLSLNETATDANALKYSFLRPIGALYYGIEQEASNYATLKPARSSVSDENKYLYITILENGDTDSENNLIPNHTKTLAFDSFGDAENQITIVVFSDSDSNLRFRLIKRNGEVASDRIGGRIWKKINDVNIKDLILYHQDTSTSENRFTFLDNNKIWFGSINSNSETTVIDDTKAIDIGENLNSFVYSKVSGNLYVINDIDQSINIISVMKDNLTPLEIPKKLDQKINLKSFISGKPEINLQPDKLILDNNTKHLLITEKETKSLIEVDISTFEKRPTTSDTTNSSTVLVDETSVTDKDNDGITIESGDCNDDDDTIYPGAIEIPNDVIDQDCDGSDLITTGRS